MPLHLYLCVDPLGNLTELAVASSRIAFSMVLTDVYVSHWLYD